MSLQQTPISAARLERSTIASEKSHACAIAEGCALVRSTGNGNKAFSLIEVVIAIGIVSFAFVTLLGLLPIGLTAFRQAMDTTVCSQIVQRVVNDAQQTDYTTLTTSGTTQLYFDDQANEVTAANANNSLYTVQVTVSGTTTLPNSAGVQSTNLATVSVQIANNPGHVAAPFASNSMIPSTTYTALIARNQSNTTQPESQSSSGVSASQTGNGNSGTQTSTQTTNP